MFSSEEILELAIQIEMNAEQVYHAVLKKTSNSSLALLLTWLIDEEARHVEWFSALKNTPDREIRKSSKNWITCLKTKWRSC